MFTPFCKNQALVAITAVSFNVSLSLATSRYYPAMPVRVWLERIWLRGTSDTDYEIYHTDWTTLHQGQGLLYIKWRMTGILLGFRRSCFANVGLCVYQMPAAQTRMVFVNAGRTHWPIHFENYLSLPSRNIFLGSKYPNNNCSIWDMCSIFSRDIGHAAQVRNSNTKELKRVSL